MDKRLGKTMIVFTDLRLGGIQRKIIDICTFLNTKNIYPILSLRYKRGIFLNDTKKVSNIITPKFHTKKLDTIFFTIWLFFKILFIKPKTIITFIDLGSIPTLFVSKLLFWRKSKIIVCEDILTSKYISTEKRPILREFLIKKLYPHASKIFVQTKIQKNDLAQIIGLKNLKKIIITPNWLPFCSDSKNKNKNKRDIDILYVGRIEKQKNIPMFISIITKIKKLNKNIKVLIVGSGNETKLINSLIKKNNLQSNIIIKKADKNIAKYYTSSKIFLLTSDFEGFPLTILESLNYGCYPIVRNIPELITFFTKDKNKFIFKNESEAVKLIQNNLIKVDNEVLIKYKDLVKKQQSKNFSKFFQSI